MIKTLSGSNEQPIIRQYTGKLPPEKIENYLRHCGWTLEHTKQSGIKPFSKIKGSHWYLVYLPLDPNESDYPDSVFKILLEAARAENSTPEKIYDEILLQEYYTIALETNVKGSDSLFYFYHLLHQVYQTLNATLKQQGNSDQQTQELLAEVKIRMEVLPDHSCFSVLLPRNNWGKPIFEQLNKDIPKMMEDSNYNYTPELL